MNVDAVQRNGGGEGRAFDEVVIETRERADEEDSIAAAQHRGTIALPGLPGETQSRRDVIPVRVHTAFGEAWIAGENRSWRRVGEACGAIARAVACHLAKHVVIRQKRIPAHAGRQRQVRGGAERVFGEERKLLAACLFELAGALREGRRLAQQQIADTVAGDLPGKRRRARLVKFGGRIENDERGVLAAGADGVTAPGPDDRIVNLHIAAHPFAWRRVRNRAPTAIPGNSDLELAVRFGRLRELDGAEF